MEMRGGEWCASLLSDKAAWGLQGLHLAMSSGVVPSSPQSGLQRGWKQCIQRGMLVTLGTGREDADMRMNT